MRRPPRPTSALLAAIASLAPVAAARGEDAPPPWVLLEAPARVDDLRALDADGDGVPDLVALAGREVRVWRGRRGALPQAAPTWTFAVPSDAAYAWPSPPPAPGGAAGPSLLAATRTGVLRLSPGGAPQPLAGVEAGVPWLDAGRARLTEFAWDASLLLPTHSGYRWMPDARGAPARGFDLDVPPVRRTDPPGGSLETRALVGAAWPAPWRGPGGTAGEAGASLWFASGGRVRGFVLDGDAVRTQEVASAADLADEGERRSTLVDFDLDGRPDLLHEATTNDSGAYTVLRTPEPGTDRRALEHRATIRLRGFQIPHDPVDLDGDGRPDLVVTAIDIDGSNVMAAVMRGRVVARTRAFLNRSASGGEWFVARPDAEVESEIRVRLLFTFSGAIDVQRSYTIVTGADLDGDGRRDLVIRTAEDRLSVRRGAPQGVWGPPSDEISIPPVGRSPEAEASAADLTGDGKDDLVVLYRAEPGGGDRIAVVAGR